MPHLEGRFIKGTGSAILDNPSRDIQRMMDTLSRSSVTVTLIYSNAMTCMQLTAETRKLLFSINAVPILA
mgnify:CR=1 FL=1